MIAVITLVVLYYVINWWLALAALRTDGDVTILEVFLITALFAWMGWFFYLIERGHCESFQKVVFKRKSK